MHTTLFEFTQALFDTPWRHRMHTLAATMISAATLIGANLPAGSVRSSEPRACARPRNAAADGTANSVRADGRCESVA
ncbi:MAG: hypothetical protein ACHQAR_05680 [Steroidobacterales bacterium]